MSQDQSDKPLQWKNQWHPDKKEFVDVIELSAYQALSERLDREVEESTEYHKMWHSTLAELRAEKEIGRHSCNRAVEAEEKLAKAEGNLESLSELLFDAEMKLVNAEAMYLEMRDGHENYVHKIEDEIEHLTMVVASKQEFLDETYVELRREREIVRVMEKVLIRYAELEDVWPLEGDPDWAHEALARVAELRSNGK